MDLKYYQRKKKASHPKMETELNTFIPLTPAKPSPPPQRLKLVYHRRLLKNKGSSSSRKFTGENSSERCLIDLNAPPPMESEEGHKELESFGSCLSEELEPLSREPTMPKLCGFEGLQTATDLASSIPEESSSLPKELEPLSQEMIVPELGEFEILQIATDPTSPITEESSSLPKELEPLSKELAVLGGFELLQTATDLTFPEEFSSVPKELEPFPQERTVPELAEFVVLEIATDPTSPYTEESTSLCKEFEPLSQELTVPKLGEFETLQTAPATDPTSLITEESRSLGKFILVHCEDPVTPCLPPPKKKFKQKRRKHVPKVLVEGKKKKTPLHPPRSKKKTNSMLKEKNVLIPKKSVRIPACRKSLKFETVENGNNREIIHTENNSIDINAQDCQKQQNVNKLGLFSLKWKRKNKRMARYRKLMLYSILWSVIPRTLKTYQPHFIKKKKRSKLFQQRLNLASTAAIFPQTGTQVPQTRCEVLLQSQNLAGDKLIFQDSQLIKGISFPSNADMPTIESEVLPGELRQDTLQYESITLQDDKLQFFINEFLGLNISGKNEVNGSSAPIHYSDVSSLVTPKSNKNREEKELAIVPYLNGGELATLDSKKKRKKKKRVLRHELPIIAFDSSTLRQLELIKSRSTFLLKSNGEEDEDEGWEKQRKLFASRVKLFIDKMKYMQGDRSFKPWKGSVVDSIVGVYLTQNVSDTLSSNVYMQLLAKFPLQTVAEYSPVSHELYMRPVPLPWETETEEGKLQPSSEVLRPFELEPCQEISILEAQLPGKFSLPMELSESRSRKRTADGGDNDDETKKRKKEVIEEKERDKRFRWERLKKIYSKGSRTMDQMDSADWEAVRCAKPEEVSDAIHGRGQHTILAMRIQNFLNLVVTNQNGSMDLEWLRNAPPEEVKEFLLGIDGLGLKSVECLRLLSLQNIAFPVDVNVARITVRLGWVPLQPLPGDLQFHALEEYPILDRVQEYLWPRLRTLDQKTLYELHYQMITFGKVFCTKRKPNCNACPMREECRHYASATASGRFALPRQPEEGMKNTAQASYADMVVDRISSSSVAACSSSAIITGRPFVEMTKLPEPRLKYPIVEMPMSPEREKDIELVDIEDLALDYGNYTSITRCYNYNYNYNYKMDKVSDALVNVLPSHYSIPMPKVKDIADLRTVHLVFELPDHHPILHEFERHDPDDPFPYLFAIWSPGETENSMDLPVPSNRCSMGMLGAFCDEPTCYNCNKIRQQDQRYLRGTILIPCRTAMRGSFPLNGTYFQVTEVFADEETSKRPIDVSWDSLRGCNRSFVCIGSSISAMLKGLSAEEIRSCFLHGYICVRGFNRKTRQPRPLSLRLHAGPSKRAAKKKEERNQAKEKTDYMEKL